MAAKKKNKSFKIEQEIESLEIDVDVELSMLNDQVELYNLQLQQIKFQNLEIEQILELYAKEIISKYIYLPYLLKKENYELCEKITRLGKLYGQQIVIVCKEMFGKTQSKGFEKYIISIEKDTHEQILKTKINYEEEEE